MQQTFPLRCERYRILLFSLTNPTSANPGESDFQSPTGVLNGSLHTGKGLTVLDMQYSICIDRENINRLGQDPTKTQESSIAMEIWMARSRYHLSSTEEQTIITIFSTIIITVIIQERGIN
jgi:hypothetical protein